MDAACWFVKTINTLYALALAAHDPFGADFSFHTLVYLFNF